MRKFIIIMFTQFLFATGVSAQSQQELRDSLSTFVAQIEAQPGNVTLRMRKAALNIELWQWNDALDEYDKVLEIQPENLTALHYRAFVNQQLSRYNFARADYEAVLVREPMHMPSLMGLIITNCMLGQLTKAFDDANRLVDMYPDSACVYDVRAEVEQNLKMIVAATDDVERAIDIEEKEMKSRGVTRLTIADDMVSYKLRAFELYGASYNKTAAKECLNYLTAHGIPKQALADYYQKLAALK